MFDPTFEDLSIPLFANVIESVASQLPKLEEIESIMPLIWSEHCLECSAPECYCSCIMYQPDRYGKCKRTEYGLRVLRDKHLSFPAVQLKYRKWGKLRCIFNSKSSYAPKAFLKEYGQYLKVRDIMLTLGKPLNFLKDSHKDLLGRFVRHQYIKRFRITDGTAATQTEELDLIFYSLEKTTFLFVLDSYDDQEKLIAKQTRTVKPGLNIWRIPASKLTTSNQKPKALELYPYNNFTAELVFFFSDLVTYCHDSVFYRKQQNDISKDKPASKAKCVVWDLDNTLWNGIIGEDGIENITLRTGVSDIIRKLDDRGVLQTICSKNDYDLAWKAICQFGLDQFFLYPQINWEPKSNNIRKIEKLLNINADTFVFVDDSKIEREEVVTMIPNMRVYPETIIDTILFLPEFDLPVTADSKKRRRYYMSDIQRNTAFEKSESGDYKSFIKQCGFKVELSECSSKEDIDRCHELIQRTNQLNASTNRIEYYAFKNMIEQQERIVLKVSCEDSYGTYGIVGCITLEQQNDVIICTDFVISCRVARKKVENAILSALMDHYQKNLMIIYRPTQRNKVLLDEFLAAGGIYVTEKNVIKFERGKVKEDDWVTVINLCEKQ